ncbi:MAG: FAD-binding protein, partial [Rhodospirillaceae bacterium]|nr:FAD-binding protein [Rhodospirillaceae bacterium]
MQMPEPDSGVIARRADILQELRRIVPGDGVIAEQEGLRAYECDGLTAYRQLPLIVVLPETTEQISRILRYCKTHNVKIVPRGAGTSLSGGA